MLKLALCTPLPIPGSIQTWKTILQDKFIVKIITSTQDWDADIVFYYGSQKACQKSTQEAQQARLFFESQRCISINNFDCFNRVRDKIVCGQIFDQNSLLHPSLDYRNFEEDQQVIIKPRFGSCGKDVVCDISLDEALTIKEKSSQDMIIQKYVKSKTLRVVASQTKALYAYHKQSDAPIASISQGAKRVYIPINEELEHIACQTVKAVKGDLLGVDILFDEHQYYVLEANTGFAIYKTDTHTHQFLVEEFERIVQFKQ